MGKTLTQSTKSLRQQPTYEVEMFSASHIEMYWREMEKELLTIPQYWSDCWTLEAIRESAIQGYINVWGIGPSHRYEMIALTQVCAYPAAKVLRIFLVFGRMTGAAVDALDAALENFARTNDCGRIEMLARVGFERFLRSRGVKPAGIVLTRAVEKMARH